MDNLISKIIAKNFPSPEKEKNNKVQEAYRTSSCQDQK
jgi:hypothetical protein